MKRITITILVAAMALGQFAVAQDKTKGKEMMQSHSAKKKN